MAYDLFIGDRTFSSWSLRGWLMFEKFNIPYKTHMIGLYGGTMADDLAPLAPARLVPVMRTPEGDVLQDTFAMGETLAERHPDAGLWPSDQSARIFARWLVAELHSGFMALRDACPMDLSNAYENFIPSEAVLADLKRLETLWNIAFNRFGGESDWLFGEYSFADAFFAPVAARIAAYELPVGERAASYVTAHLSDGAFRKWRAMGLTKSYNPFPYNVDLTKGVWPGPTPIHAVPVAASSSENSKCPYSGKPVTHFLEIEGRVFGFCNAFCRDKTVNDPATWPDFMEIYQS